MKDFRQVTNLNRNKIFNDTPEFADKPDELKKDYIIETGKAYGADFQLKYEKNNFYLWAVYSYTYVDRFDGIQDLQSGVGPPPQREPRGQLQLREIRLAGR